MSLTARERRNPPPRRKSCAACIKAKRRCDMALPACLRCSQRRIACSYPSRPARAQLPISSQPATMPGLLIDDETCLTPSTGGQIEGSCDDFNSVTATIDTGFVDLPSFELSLSDEALDLIEQSSTVAPLSTKELDSIPDVIANRLQWSIDQIRKAPSTMVSETQTPWCHPLVYKDAMPRSIQDAHACCALYLAKNRVNAPVILRSIESRVSDLLCSPPPNTALECLAHTQSLLLYLIIRLFDGDIGARASAERDISAIETSAISLFSQAKFDFSQASDLPTFPIAPTKTFWQEWILHESIRRTLILTFYFLQTYRIISHQNFLACDGRLGLCHSMTLSRYLWEARTPMAFAEAWMNKKHLVVTNGSFNNVFEEAMADDIDTFGKIFITSLVGIDEAEAWFASRGGRL
ncbi:hypothetical protein B0T10DRAFT_489281 [Thelonectria olida]|uniref:Zn(2)-C6 fungal-type domain-containing protein n=1 Tax=Thelonectria olida TaxID=1576542 RepID=A0A9P8W1Y0_9HYPO|nr:hypothetical protein B0T10DRAFT_489281 [Thelonectria olida]